MKTMNDVEVVISNKKYLLSGYESNEYLQSVAAYINGKHEEIKGKDTYHRLEQDMRNILIELNMADDVFKAREQNKNLDVEIEKKNEELFDMKHELIAMQSKLDDMQKELQSLKFEHLEAQKHIVKLETELNTKGKRNK